LSAINRAANCGPGPFSVWPGHSVKGLSLRSLATLALDLSPKRCSGPDQSDLD
jgi:hypothetical protein